GCCTRKVTKLLLFGASGRARFTNQPHRTPLSRRSQPQFWGRGRPCLEDHAEHVVIFVGDASGEVQPAIGEEQCAQTIEVERNSENIARRAGETTGARIVNVDFAVPKVADPELAVDDLKAPGRIEPAI